MKITLTIDEVRKKLGVNEIEISAIQMFPNEEIYYRKVVIYNDSHSTTIQTNSRANSEDTTKTPNK